MDRNIQSALIRWCSRATTPRGSLLAVALLALASSASLAVAQFAAECAAPPDGAVPVVVIGEVSCQRLESQYLGGETPFTYYVPPGCDPAESAELRCPVLYLLHGLVSDYRTMLGTSESPSAWVAALSSGPPVDPRQVLDPWNYGDPADWIPLEPLDMIIVAPHGQTIPDGFGPGAGADSAWLDWNPRYALGGDSERYSTPAPRFSSFLVEELLPFVEQYFPAGQGREWRALAGRSFGGLGTYNNGLQHPDLFSTLNSISGVATAVLPGLGGIETIDPPVGVGNPADLPYVPPPPGPFAVAPEDWFGLPYVRTFFAVGDPATDEAWWRRNNPGDLALNARASAAGVPSLHLLVNHNDTIPRRPEDFTEASALQLLFFEPFLMHMNLSLQAHFELLGVQRRFELHPGIHTQTYTRPYYRQWLADQYAHMRHRDGSGSPPPRPRRFDYRTMNTDFTIWDWQIQVEREALEFLDLRDVSCAGLTLVGSGLVEITVPDHCGTGLDGETTFAVDLGPPSPIDEPVPLPARRTREEVVLRALP